MKAFAHLALLAFWVVSTSANNGVSCQPLASQWPHWRGPLATGASPTANPPTEWSETKNLRWKVPLPGTGHSSPIVFGDAVYLLAAAPKGNPLPPVFDSAPGVHDSVPVTHRHEYFVLALSRNDGTQLWKTIVREEFPHEGGHVTGSQVSGSPVTDGELLYAFFGSRGLYCLDFKGRIIWQKNLGKMQTLHAHGEGSSPVIHQEKLIVNWDHEGDSFLYAFHKRTGAELWKVRRDEKTSWSTPLIVEVDGKHQVVVSATKRIRGYDLDSGQLIWECAGLTDNVVASPVFTNGVLIAGTSYYQQAMVALKLTGAKGDLTGTGHVLWSLKRNTPYVPSPLLYHDTLFVIRHNQNVLGRIDPLTGAFRDEAIRLEGIRDFIFSSPVAAAGRVYITGRDGTTQVLDAKTGKTLAVNRLKDSFSASAALAANELYLRGEEFLYCLAEQPAEPPAPAPK